METVPQNAPIGVPPVSLLSLVFFVRWLAASPALGARSEILVQALVGGKSFAVVFKSIHGASHHE